MKIISDKVQLTLFIRQVWREWWRRHLLPGDEGALKNIQVFCWFAWIFGIRIPICPYAFQSFHSFPQGCSSFLMVKTFWNYQPELWLQMTAAWIAWLAFCRMIEDASSAHEVPLHLLVGGLEHVLFFHILGINNPNWLIFFRGVLKPPTRSHWVYWV
jgi:hypothetical protein